MAESTIELTEEQKNEIAALVYNMIIGGQEKGINYDNTVFENPTTEAEQQKFTLPVIKDLGLDEETAGNINLRNLFESFGSDVINLNTQAKANLTTLNTYKTDAVNAKNAAIEAKEDAIEAQGLAESARDSAESAKDAAQQAKQDAEASKTSAASSATSAASSKSAAEAAEDNVSTMKGQIETLISQAEDITQQKHVLPVTLDSEIKGLSITRKASRVYISLNDIEEETT